MTKFKPGDDVIVKMKAREHHGEVIEQRSGYVMCRIQIDPQWDYGSTTWLDPEPTVCVPEKRVRHAD
jgi:hypothetical protein